jgi:plasmid stability protein
MSNQTVTLNIPDPLYRQLKERAEQAERSIEDETLDVIASVVPFGARLPDDLTNAVESLPSLDNAALWNAARSRLAVAVGTGSPASETTAGGPVGGRRAEARRIDAAIRASPADPRGGRRPAEAAKVLSGWNMTGRI